MTGSDRTSKTIGNEIAREGMLLLSTAMGELMEDAAADAVRVQDGEWKLMVGRANQLKAVGADIMRLADALEVLARRAGEP